MGAPAPPVNTTALAAAITGIARTPLPGPVRDQARRLLLDTVACIAAARETEVARIAWDAATLFAPEPGDAYRLARLADCMDFNEGYSGAHFGCTAVAVLLALGRNRPMDGKAALGALAAGFEAGARVTDAIGPYYAAAEDDGSRFAPVWGIGTQMVFAAVATAAALLDLDEATTVRAYDLAGSNVPIPIGAKWSAATELPNTKYADAGWCAMAGLFAALQARAGSTAPAELLGMPHDLFGMVGAGSPNPAALADPRWRLPDMRFKAWPACGLIRAPMTALQGLCAQAGIAASAITGIVAEVSPTVALPRFANQDPATFVARQFSLPHAATMLLLGLPPSAAWLDPAIARHPTVSALRSRIAVRASAAPIPPQQCAVQVTAGNQVHDAAPGPLPAPVLDDAALRAKFVALVRPEDADRLLPGFDRLEALDDCRALFETAAAARPIPTTARALAMLDAA